MPSPEQERTDRDLRSYAAFTLVAMVGIGVGLCVCANPPSANTLLALLEQRFPRAEIGNGMDVAGVIALGGNPERIREAARLAQRYPHLQVIVTGAGGRAEVLSLIGPHVSPDRIAVEGGTEYLWERISDRSHHL